MRLLKHYWYELPLAYLLLCGFNFFFVPDSLGFVDIDPHPYWAIILIFGFRYGVVAGLLSGIIASILYLSFAWVFVERYLFEEISFYLLPSCFLLVGVAVGIGVSRYREKISDFEKEKTQWLHHEKQLKEEIETLKSINLALEKQITTRMATLATLYEGAKRLEILQVDLLYPSILEFITKTLNAEMATLYVKIDTGWKLEESWGFTEEALPKEFYADGEGVVGLAAQAGKILSIRDFLSGEMKEHNRSFQISDVLLAGPLRKGETGEVVGVVAIQRIPFARLNSATVNLFHFLLGWGSRALGRAIYIQDLKEQEVLDPEFQVYSYRYFCSRLEQEFLRSKTYYLPLTLVLAQLDGLERLDPAKQLPVLLSLGQLLKEGVRNIDVVARYPEPSIPFAMLLVTASQDQASAIQKKLLNYFERLKLKNLSLKLGLADFSPAVNSMQELLERAKENLRHAI